MIQSLATCSNLIVCLENMRSKVKVLQLCFLSHLLIAGCDIGVQISVRPYVRPSVRSSVRPSTFTSKFSFLDISDSCESETLHSNCP